MNPMLLRRRSKVILRAGSAYQSREVVATLQMNLQALGFEMAPALCERVATLSRDALETFYTQLIGLLREMLGAHRAYTPLYPDFPAQMMNASEAERYWNAWLHYRGLLDQVGSASARTALAKLPRWRVLELGTQEELDALFAQLVAARVPYSPEDRDDVRWYVAQYRERAFGCCRTRSPARKTWRWWWPPCWPTTAQPIHACLRWRAMCAPPPTCCASPWRWMTAMSRWPRRPASAVIPVHCGAFCLAGWNACPIDWKTCSAGRRAGCGWPNACTQANTRRVAPA